MHAGQVARVGEFPGETDRGLEAELELLEQRQRDGRHARFLSEIIREAASVARAARYFGRSSMVTPASMQAARADGCWASDATTATNVGLLRKDSRRVPKW